jgi:carnitine O-acetyltransferase
VQFDATGKVTLDHIYAQPDPRPYFATLHALDYQIPQLAKPYFRRLIDAYRMARGVDRPLVVDIGSSYGINAALLRGDLTMDDLYARYTAAAGQSREELLAGDRELVRLHAGGSRARYVGLDISGPALAYAREAGFLDDAVHADLEVDETTEDQRAQLAGADLVISTGCLGYVGVNTLSQVMAASADRQPWMAHFMLRMFSFDPIAECLADYGYHTFRQAGVFRQRRFASPDEQSQVLDTLSAAGVDPQGLETDGWFYAQLFLSRPRARVNATTIDLVTDTTELSVK